MNSSCQVCEIERENAWIQEHSSKQKKNRVWSLIKSNRKNSNLAASSDEIKSICIRADKSDKIKPINIYVRVAKFDKIKSNRNVHEF